MAATVDGVSDVPTAPGSFDARLTVVLDRKSKWLMPGMTCKVKLVPYLKKDAVDRAAEGRRHRRVGRRETLRLGGGQGRQVAEGAVTLGEKTEKQIEILKGLAEGEKILLEAPKDAKKVDRAEESESTR